ncbi:MAG: DNA-processing protein DprA [Hyphomonadaceae bacterium]
MNARILGAGERVSWMRLARTPRIGPLTFHRLVARFGGADAALEALPRLAREAPPAPPPVARIEDELAALERLGAHALASCETAYPHALAQLDAPPPAISVRGRMDLFAKPCVALVGAREASAAGVKLAGDLARDLGAMGYVIVSGLARGVDAAAHAAALETGTIAVLAGGLDKPYPPQNERLHTAIAEAGCVVSEAPLGAVARARDFPRRNHLISGLSRGVVVVEAALRSGSLITARAAGEQGRDVMAAPGSPLDPRARGANALIKQGAALIENAEDVVAVLGAAPERLRAAPRVQRLLEEPAGPAPAAPDIAPRLARLLSATPIHVNELARQLGAGVGAVAAAITELELEGRAATLPGGYAASAGAAFPAA